MARYGDEYDPDVIRALVSTAERLERRVADLEGRRMMSADRGFVSDIDDPVEGQMLVEGTTLLFYAEGKWRGPTYPIKVISDTATLATGDGQFIFTVTEEEGIAGLNLIHVKAYVTTVSSSGLPTVQVRNITQAVDMLSTKVSIDASEYSSDSAATPAVIDTANDDIALGDRIAIDVDVAGTGAKGLGVILAFGR